MTWRKQALAAYVALTLSVGTGFIYTHSAVEQIHQNTVDFCNRGNVLRSILHDIILSGTSQTEKFVTEGTITKAQAIRSIQFAHDAANKLRPVNCADATSTR